MSMGNRCKCRAPLVVTQRRCNHSAFNGYKYTPSDWSEVRCTACGWSWRTKAKYVTGLADAVREGEAGK